MIFCSFFYALGIKEDYMKVGIGLQDGKQDYVLSWGWSALEEGVWRESFEGTLNYMQKNGGWGLLKAKISLLLNKLYAPEVAIHHHLPN